MVVVALFLRGSIAGGVTGEDIYAQRIDANGVLNWTINGIAICSATSVQAQVAIISDGNGGAIITWTDFRNGTDADIYAQRVNRSGVVQWTADGVSISGAPDNQTYPILVSDGNGGAIFTWTDNRSPGNIYAQGINADGTLKWSEVPVCTRPEGQIQPAIISDGSGGAIIVWRDARNQSNGTSSSDIYAQHTGANGLTKWTTDGIGICEAFRAQLNPMLISDDSGGAIISWQDERNGNEDIFAQRINADGIAQWTADGIGIITTPDNQTKTSITSDQAGGAIFAWEDWSGYVNNIYTQRVSGNGVILWAIDGVPIGTPGKFSPNLVSDGNEGAMLVWEDYGGTVDGVNAQHLDAIGTELWGFGGVVVSNAYGSQLNPRLVNDNNGGIIIVWDDTRNTNPDIYAQHMQADGTLGGSIITADTTIPLNNDVSVYPNPADKEVFINVSSLSSESPVVVSLLDLSGTTLETISGNGIIKLTLDTYKPSSYILQIRSNNHIIIKLIIKK
jgi:Secretion system C-terminal sorting domain